MDNELAYLAGFIDGEGHIAIGINRSNRGIKRWYLRFACHQLDPRPLQRLKDRFGGSIQKTVRSGHRDIYEWVSTSRMAAAAIVSLQPFLVVKAEEAAVALEFQDLVSANPPGYRPHLTKEQETARQDCYLRLRALKQRTYELGESR